MKEAITQVKGWIDDIVHLLMSFVAVGAMSEVLFGSGVFGVNVIGNRGHRMMGAHGLAEIFQKGGFTGADGPANTYA